MIYIFVLIKDLLTIPLLYYLKYTIRIKKIYNNNNNKNHYVLAQNAIIPNAMNGKKEETVLTANLIGESFGSLFIPFKYSALRLSSSIDCLFTS